MRKLIAILLVLALPLLMAADDAQEEERERASKLMCGLRMPCNCDMDQVAIEVICDQCCNLCDREGTFIVEFIYGNGSVLGTTEIDGPWCIRDTKKQRLEGGLAPMVVLDEVDYVKITWTGVEDLCLNRFRLEGYVGDECDGRKWKKLFGCELPFTFGQGENAYEILVLMP
jgi:hypothetical protein